MKHKKLITVISSVIILLPIAFGLIVWDKLPQTITTHWGADGTANGWQSRLTVVLQPLFFLVLHFVCIGAVYFDKRNKFQNPIVMNLLYWLMPALSIFTCFVIYANALGFEVSVMFFTQLFIGLLFFALGIVMPKMKQNSFVGIRVKWTLENEDNWNATHKIGGKIWAWCGAVMVLSSFLPSEFSLIILTGAILVSVIVPIVYSYKYSKR